MKILFKGLFQGIKDVITMWIYFAIIVGINIKTTQPDVELQYFVDGMKKDFPKKFTVLGNLTKSITFSDGFETGVIGLCYLGFNHIRINKKFWDLSSDLERRALVYHEMAHCTFFQGHRDGLFLDGCPESIMNSYIPTPKCLNEYWPYYLKELEYYM